MVYEQIVLITGISGAGKSTAIRCFEDMGFFCVDNLPVTLIPEMLDKFVSVDNNITKLGFGIDIREKDFLSNFSIVLDYFYKINYSFKVLFLESEDDVLLRRFIETRRKHPLSSSEDHILLQNIIKEKNLLKEIRQKADIILDTSKFSTSNLKEKLK